MARIIIVIETDNDAFGETLPEREAEVGRILYDLSANFEKGMWGPVLYDINGNRTGSVAWSPGWLDKEDE